MKIEEKTYKTTNGQRLPTHGRRNIEEGLNMLCETSTLPPLPVARKNKEINTYQ